jgi:AraC family transcriptional regulator
VRIPAQLYAVFRHRGHVSEMRRTVNTIWNKWLPASGRAVAPAPDFERYQDFDDRRGTGKIEVWLPLKP